jgi:PAS domain-containing protein
VAVQEVAMLRDALQAAGRRNAEARRALEDDIAERLRVESELLEAHESLQEQQRLIDLTQEAGRVGFCQYRFASGEMVWTTGHAKLFGLDKLEGSGLEAWLQRIAADDREGVRQALATPAPTSARGRRSTTRRCNRRQHAVAVDAACNWSTTRTARRCSSPASRWT